MPGFPLKGVRVTDFTWHGAGPFMTKHLADHGADVIRIESSKRLDGLRSGRPFRDGIPGVNRSGYFANRNTNKRDITMSLKDPRAREIALKLIAQSDVVANNFGPGTMEGFGLGYEDCKAVKPDIIFISMTVNGTEGPEREEVGFGIGVAALAGLTHLSGRPDFEPVGTGTNYPDHIAVPNHSVFAVLAALRHKRRTGKGQFIDLAQVEAMTSLLGPVVMDYTVNQYEQMRDTNHVPYAVPHGTYLCAGPGEDRWITLAARTDEEWRELTEELGAPEWRTDERFVTIAARHRNVDALDGAITDKTKQLDAYELMERMQRRRVPAGVMQTAQDLIERDPQEKFRNHFVKLDHPEMGPSLYDAPPYHLSGMTEPPLRTAAPLLGQHTHEVLLERLGMSAEEVDKLIEEGVLV